MPIEADQFAATLADSAQQLESADLSPFWESTARPMVLQNVRDNFTSSVSPDGEEWPARKQIGDGHPLLMETGDLMQSAVGGGAGHINQVAPRELVLGTNEEKALWHTEGTANMPDRQFMGASEATEEAIGEELADFLLPAVFGDA